MTSLYIACFVLILLGIGKAEVTVTPVSYEYEDVTGEAVTVDCVIEGLTKAAENVVWTKDGTDVLTLGGGYKVNVGNDGFYDGSQITYVEIQGSDKKRESTTFTCVVTVPDTETTVQATPEVVFYTITPLHKTISSNIDQTLTCTIKGLKDSASVFWMDHEGIEIEDSMQGYTKSLGPVDKNRVQETTLTIAPDILAMVEGTTGNDTVYKCAVEPKKYTVSPMSSYHKLNITFVPPKSQGDKIYLQSTMLMTCLLLVRAWTF